MRSKKTVLNILSSLSLQIIVIISSLIVPKLIISSFGSDVNGLVTSITQFLAYITLLESGIGPVVKAALYKPLATKNKHEIVNILKSTEKFFKTIGKIFIVYLILLFLFYPILVNNEFNYLYTISLILIISISTFFEYFFGLTYQLFLDAKQESYIINFLRIGTYILNIIAVIILIKLNSNIHIIKLVSGMIFIIRPIITNLYVKKKNNINLEEADDNYKLEKKWDGLAQHIAAIIHGNTDITLLTLFSKLSEVSVYSVYYLIINGVKKITSSFTGGIDALFGDMLAKGENEKLSKTFNLYEIMYFSIITIFYICTLVLIVPFVSVYTKNISDVNYLRPTFAMILTLSEFVWSIRLPYSSITLAAGHFKETRVGAWVEVFTNIVISTILVIKHGIIGVAIGTLIAMIIRTIEFIYHSNKYILKRNIILTLKKIFIMLIEVLVITLICHNYINIEIINYQSWVLYGIIIFVICTMIIMIINYIVFNKESKELIAIIKKYIKKRRNKKMKTYFVTGGAGFIGSSLVSELLKKENKVVVIDNFCDFYNPEIKEKNISEFNDNESFKLYRGDIRDKELLNKIFEENSFDAVIHLAAMAGVRPSIENPILYQDVNCMGTQNILEVMKKHNLKKLVMASSSSVYGNTKEVPFREDMIVDFAISPYAATKKANEVMTHVYHKLEDYNVIMLRFFTVYGPKQRPDLAINKFTRLMLEGKEIPMFGDGSNSRDYTYISDIVDGIIRSINYVENNTDVYEIINLGNSSPVTLKEMINTIAEVLNIEPKINELPMQPGDVDRTYADVSKAKRLLGYEPKVPFKTGIENFVKWYKGE